MNITVKSDFQAVIEMLEDKKFSSFWESMLKNELDRYASSIDELKEALEIGDVNVLKEINIALKKSNMIKATPDIKQWLTEVMMLFVNKMWQITLLFSGMSLPLCWRLLNVVVS